jgi:hypothetical protein
MKKKIDIPLLLKQAKANMHTSIFLYSLIKHQPPDSLTRQIIGFWYEESEVLFYLIFSKFIEV